MREEGTAEFGEGEDLDSLVQSVADQMVEEAGETIDDEPEEAVQAAETEETVEEAPEEGEDEKPAEKAAQADEGEEPEGPPPLQAPEHWPKEIQDAFNVADRTAQEAWLAQQREFQRGFNEQSQKLKDIETEQQRFAETRHVLEQYAPFWQAQGMSVAQGVGQLASWAMALAQNPAQTIPQLAQMYGLDLAELAQGQPYVAPEDAARDQRMRQLEQRLTQQDQQMAEQRQNQLVGQIEAFRDQTDADGSPAHPHFDEVVDSMIGMYKSGFQGSLQEAYEQACWTSPEVRQKLIQGVQKQTTEQASLQRLDDAKRAKQASQQRVRKASPRRGDSETDGMSDDELIAHLAMQQVS